MKYDISISIVVYRNYKDAEKAIESIYNFTSDKINKKVYIIDNGAKLTGSQDVNKFLKFLSIYPNVEYIDAKENLGFGKAHNLVINMIDSKYHTIVNPDIVLLEDSFSKLVNFMESNEDIGMTIPKLVDNQGNLQYVYRHELTLFDMFNRMFLKSFFKKRDFYHTMHYKDYSMPFKVPFGQGSFLFIRTYLFKKLEGFDENFFMYVEDADLCKRVNKVSKLMYYPYTEIVHNWEKGSHKNLLLLKYHIKSTIYYFKKWGIKIF